MAFPHSYDEGELASYMHAVIGKTAGVLGWTAPESYREAVNDALLAYGVTDIAEATDITRLRACARLAVWQAVADDTAAFYTFATDQQRFERRQVHEHANAMLTRARVTAMRHGIGLTIEADPIERIDPYTVVPDSERRR